MFIKYEINGMLQVDTEERKCELDDFNAPKIGQVVKPFMQDYEYWIIDIICTDKYPPYHVLVKLTPKNEYAKTAFKRQYLNFKKEHPKPLKSKLKNLSKNN